MRPSGSLCRMSWPPTCAASVSPPRPQAACLPHSYLPASHEQLQHLLPQCSATGSSKRPATRRCQALLTLMTHTFAFLCGEGVTIPTFFTLAGLGIWKKWVTLIEKYKVVSLLPLLQDLVLEWGVFWGATLSRWMSGKSAWLLEECPEKPKQWNIPYLLMCSLPDETSMEFSHCTISCNHLKPTLPEGLQHSSSLETFFEVIRACYSFYHPGHPFPPSEGNI